MRKYTFRILFFLLFTSPCAFAQWVPNELKSSPRLFERDENNLTAEVEMLGFFKNNEYFSPIAKGETLPGTRLIPKVGYQVGTQLKAELGFVGMYFSGDQQKKGIQIANSLYARLNYAPTRNLNLILGNLNGGVNHRLIEPLYKWERHLIDKPESGVQVIYENDKFFLDSWVDWQRFIVRGDPVPELLNFGLSTSLNLLPKASAFQLSIPLQVHVHHQGGQIEISDEPMIVAGNVALGLISDLKLGEGFIKKVGLDVYGVGFLDKLKNDEVRKFNQGVGVYPVFRMESQKFKFMAGYWSANNFYSYEGEPLFRSFNELHPEELQKSRSLVTAKLAYSHQPHKLFSIGAYAETYTDLDRSDMDYSFGVHIRFYTGR